MSLKSLERARGPTLYNERTILLNIVRHKSYSYFHQTEQQFSIIHQGIAELLQIPIVSPRKSTPSISFAEDVSGSVVRLSIRMGIFYYQ